MDRTAWGLLRDQHRIVHVNQLSALGVTRAALDWRVRSGRWRRVLPRVYATVTGDLTERQRMIAASLYAGPAAQLFGLSALRFYQLRYLPAGSPAVQVLVPHSQRVRSQRFVEVHRSLRMDPKPWRNGVLVVCHPARAVVDAALGSSSLEQVRAMVAEAVQSGLATVPAVAAEFAHARRNGSGLLRTALAEVADGVRSVAEAGLRSSLTGSTILPRVRWNAQLVGGDGRRLPTPDGWIDEVGLALEVDSRQFHLSPQDWARTLARHNEWSRYGAQVLHLPPAQIAREPATVRELVEESYLQRWRGGARADIKIMGS